MLWEHDKFIPDFDTILTFSLTDKESYGLILIIRARYMPHFQLEANSANFEPVSR